MDERFKNKGNALGRLVEELGESTAAAGKTIRYGWDSWNPLLPVNERETNEAWLRRELIDVLFAIRRLATSRGWNFETMVDKSVDADDTGVAED